MRDDPRPDQQPATPGGEDRPEPGEVGEDASPEVREAEREE